MFAVGVYFVMLSVSASGKAHVHDAGGADRRRWQFRHPEVWLLVAGISPSVCTTVSVIGPKVVPAGTPVVTAEKRVAFVCGTSSG